MPYAVYPYMFFHKNPPDEQYQRISLALKVEAPPQNDHTPSKLGKSVDKIHFDCMPLGVGNAVEGNSVGAAVDGERELGSREGTSEGTIEGRADG
jgi:hypothetical protein